MAPAAPRAETPADIQKRRDDIVRSLQHGLDIHAGFHKGGFDAIMALVYTSFHRSDHEYVEKELLPIIRKRLSYDGVPLEGCDDVQVIAKIEIEGNCVCECWPCRCAIRYTLMVTIKSIHQAPQNQNANGN